MTYKVLYKSIGLLLDRRLRSVAAISYCELVVFSNLSFRLAVVSVSLQQVHFNWSDSYINDAVIHA